MSDQKNRRVLIVDDNAAIHDDFSKIVGLSRGSDRAIGRATASLFGEAAPTIDEPMGYELAFAFQGQEALAHVLNGIRAGRAFSLAFIDVRMPPGWDGVETVRRIWEVDPELQVVFCTAYSDYSWNDMIRVLGETDRMLILKKPFDNVEVRQMASALTKKWQLAREARQTTEHLERLVEERTSRLTQANQQLTAEIAERARSEQALRQLEAQLAHSQRLEAVGALAGGVAHEFNNLLQAIQGYTRFAMEGLPPDDQRYQDLDRSLQMSKRAALITRELLGFSRRQVLDRTDVSPNEIVQDVVKLLQSLIGKHVEIRVDLSEDAGTIHVDPAMLQQMLLNLCFNARDAMPGGGTLAIGTQNIFFDDAYCEIHPGTKPGRYLMLRVTDTGCGMSHETLQHLFEPFYTTKEVGKGTGLGLAMVYGVVQQHGGTIRVKSELGVGTTLSLYLPTVELAPDVPKSAWADEPAVANGR